MSYPLTKTLIFSTIIAGSFDSGLKGATIRVMLHKHLQSFGRDFLPHQSQQRMGQQQLPKLSQLGPPLHDNHAMHDWQRPYQMCVDSE